MIQTNQTQSGLSLVELVVGMGIIGVLASFSYKHLTQYKLKMTCQSTVLMGDTDGNHHIDATDVTNFIEVLSRAAQANQSALDNLASDIEDGKTVTQAQIDEIIPSGENIFKQAGSDMHLYKQLAWFDFSRDNQINLLDIFPFVQNVGRETACYTNGFRSSFHLLDANPGVYSYWPNI